jgi:phosphate:Na+ symporter
MDLPLILIDLAGSVALLLWGVHMVQTGVQRAFGARLRGFLATALRHRISAFLAGIGVTALLQSSTATGLMVTGFTAGGLVELVPALAVMLGANVGTTLIVQVLSFDVAALAPAFILAGVVIFRRAQAGMRDFGRVLIGLGLLLLALSQFVGLLRPYASSPDVHAALALISSQGLVDVILAALLTWAAHSSVAVVLLIMSFASHGDISPYAAFALVLGANLGTAINPVIEGATGHDRAAKRLPVGNLLNRLAGVVVALAVLGPLAPLVSRFGGTPSHAVANFHTAFNLVIGLIFFPLLSPYGRLLQALLPTRIDKADPAIPLYLVPSAASAPVVALGAASRESLRLVDLLLAMLQGLRDAMQKGDRRRITATKRHNAVLKRLEAAISFYLTTLETDSLNAADFRRIREILAFCVAISQAADVVHRGLLGIALRKLKRGLSFPVAGQTALIAMIDTLIAGSRAAAAVFISEQRRGMEILTGEQVVLDDLEAAATAAHFGYLRDGNNDVVEASAMLLEAMRGLKQVHAYLIAAVGVDHGEPSEVQGEDGEEAE